MDVKYKKFDSKTSLKEQRNLFKECFPENINSSFSSSEHYYWKHKNYHSSFEFSAILNSKLVGYYAALPYNYHSNAGIMKVGMVCDVMTGKKSRGKGVFTELGKYSTAKLKENGLDFTTGFPIRKEVIPGHLKAGWDIAFSLPFYVKIKSIKSILKKNNLSFLSPIFDLIIKIIFIPFNISYQKKNISIVNVDIDEFFQSNDYKILNNEISKEHSIYLDKSAKFMRWRLSAPSSVYKISIVKLNKLVIGYIVSRSIKKFGFNCTGIVDIAFLEKHKNLVKIGVNQLCRESLDDLIILMCNTSVYKKYKLFSAGFFVTPFKFSLIIKNLSNKFGCDFLYNENHWHITWIDCDDL